MKKLLIIFLLLVYGASAFGMTLHLHYCCDKIDSLKFAPVKQHNCEVDKKIRKKGCCNDRQIDIRIKADYKSEVFSPLKLKSINEIFYFNSPSTVFFSQVQDASIHGKGSSPPLWQDIPLYKKHCIYRV